MGYYEDRYGCGIEYIDFLLDIIAEIKRDMLRGKLKVKELGVSVQELNDLCCGLLKVKEYMLNKYYGLK